MVSEPGLDVVHVKLSPGFHSVTVHIAGFNLGWTYLLNNPWKVNANAILAFV